MGPVEREEREGEDATGEGERWVGRNTGSERERQPGGWPAKDCRGRGVADPASPPCVLLLRCGDAMPTVGCLMPVRVLHHR